MQVILPSGALSPGHLQLLLDAMNAGGAVASTSANLSAYEELRKMGLVRLDGLGTWTCTHRGLRRARAQIGNRYAIG